MPALITTALSFLGSKTNIIRLVLGGLVLASFTYFYMDYKSLKEDKINLTSSLKSQNRIIDNLNQDILTQEREHEQLEIYYKGELERQKISINIIDKNNKEVRNEIKYIIKEVIVNKTDNEKQNLKKLFEILGEDSNEN